MFESRIGTVKTVRDLLRPDLVEGVDYAVISSLFRNPTIKADIEKIYNANKVEIIEHYLSSPIHESRILDSLIYREAEEASKVTGIYYWSIAKKNQALLTLALKVHKVLKRSYTMTKSFNKDAILSVAEKTMDNTFTKTENTKTDFTGHEAFLTALRLSDIYGIPMYTFEDKTRYEQSIVPSAFYGVVHYYYDSKDNSLNTNVNHKMMYLKQMNAYITSFKKAWNMKETNSYTYGYLMRIFDIHPNGHRVKAKDIPDVIPSVPESLKGLFLANRGTNMQDVWNGLSLQECTDVTIATTRILTELNGNELHDVDTQFVPKIDVDFAIAVIIGSAEVQPMAWFNTGAYVLAHVRNAMAYADYKGLRHKVLNTSQMEKANEIAQALKDKQDELNKTQKELTKSIKKNEVLEEKLTATKNLVKEHEKTTKRLQEELNAVEPNKKELIALREMMYELQKDEPEPLTEETREEKAKSITKHRLIFVGGHERWVNKMKTYVPEATWLNPDSQNRVLTHLRSGEYVVIINTATNSHSTTGKVIAEVERNKDAKLIMLPNNFGIDRTLTYIYQSLMD